MHQQATKNSSFNKHKFQRQVSPCYWQGEGDRERQTEREGEKKDWQKRREKKRQKEKKKNIDRQQEKKKDSSECKEMRQYERWNEVKVQGSPTLSRASCTTFSLSVSRAEVASSSRRILGLRTKARAIATRCFWPPDSCAPRSPTRVSYFCTVGRQVSGQTGKLADR